MKRLPVFFLFLVLFFPSIALADVKVNVKSQINSSTTSTNTSNSQTDIVINTNGEVKEYHGSGENVHLESSNSDNSVTVTNNASPTNSPKPSDSASPKPSASPSPSASPWVEIKSDEIKASTFFELIKKQFEYILELFRN